MQKEPYLLDNCKPGNMMFHFNHDRFAFFLLQVTFIIALVVSNIFSDGIVLRNGMQMVVTIRDTSGDSISIQEGMWEAGIAKSIIASFWYKGNQYSYVGNNKVNHFASSAVSNPIKKFNQPTITNTNNNDNSSISQKPVNKIDHSPEDDLLFSPDTTSAPGALQSTNAVNITPIDSTIPNDHDSSVINQLPENSAISQNEDLLPLPDTAMLADLDLGDNDTAPDQSAELEPLPLFDPEYTNEELVKKKRVFRTLLTAGCALGVTSTAVFIASNNWDVKAMAVPFMIASIPLSTVGTLKSIEYRRRLKSAEYKKRRAQLSLSLQIQGANLLISF